MDRLELVRREVDRMLKQQDHWETHRAGFVHLYGVSAVCVLLAARRGLDPQLCAIAGMLHDISTYLTGDPSDHARLSALEAEKVLRHLGCFSPEDIALVCSAIALHSAKEQCDCQFDELLKDADVLQHYLYNPGSVTARPKRVVGITVEAEARIRRWEDTLSELSIEPKIPTDARAA